MTTIGLQFPIYNSNGTVSSINVDMGDMFVRKDLFLNAGLWGMGKGGASGGWNSATSYSSPIQIGTLTNWNVVSGSGYNASAFGALKTDGTLWTWGENGTGLLGLNDVTARSSPTQVGSGFWKSISAGCHMAALKYDNTLWVWGSNVYGQLGLADVTHRSSPTQVGSLTDWKIVVAEGGSSGGGSTFAIKTDGTLWSWGFNGSGQLGVNDAVDRSSPTQVGTLTDWKQISVGVDSTLAIKTDGTLWTWGWNTYGQLGLSLTTGTQRSSPVQLGTDKNWRKIKVGDSIAFAIRNDGTLWAWGHNGYGQLGLNDLVHRSSPTQVGSLTTWKYIYVSASAISSGAVAAIKTDGTLWVWGHNGSGELGLGDVTHRSSPTQVGSLTNWKQITGGYLNTIAISAP